MMPPLLLPWVLLVSALLVFGIVVGVAITEANARAHADRARLAEARLQALAFRQPTSHQSPAVSPAGAPAIHVHLHTSHPPVASAPAWPSVLEGQVIPALERNDP